MNKIFCTYFFHTHTHLQHRNTCSEVVCPLYLSWHEAEETPALSVSCLQGCPYKGEAMVPHFHIFMSSVPLFRCLMVAVLFFIFPSSIPNSFYLFIILLCPLFPHLSILKTFMPLCWDLAALCAIESCLTYRVSFLVPPQPFLPLHILLIQTLQSVLQISATMRLHRSPKLKLWKTLLPSRLGSSYLQN